MECEVNYFGMISEKLNKTSERITINELSKDGLNLKDVFIQKYPVLKNMTFQIAINGKLSIELPKDQPISIALLPPFAGG